MTVKYYSDTLITGLSTDTKPTNVPDSSVFFEIDTGKVFTRSGGSWFTTTVTAAKTMRGMFTLGDATDGTVTISADTDLGSANFKQYNNLTVNSTVNLTGNSPLTIVVQGTLTLNGTIHVDGKGNAGGAGAFAAGGGGTGAGVLTVICNAVSGTGTLSANGTAGGNGSSGAGIASGSDSTDGSSPAQIITGSRGRGASSSTGGVASTAFAVVDRAQLSQNVSFTVPGGGGGGMGSSSTNAGGGGGGGAGGIITFAVNGATTAVTINANGGVGGNSASSTNLSGGAGSGGANGGAGGAGGTGTTSFGGNGGGGGGGLIGVFSTSDTTVKSAAGGAAGTGGTGGVAGSTGVIRSLVI